MKMINRIFLKMILAAVFVYATAGCAGNLSVVKPEKVGLSSEKLAGISFHP